MSDLRRRKVGGVKKRKNEDSSDSGHGDESVQLSSKISAVFNSRWLSYLNIAVGLCVAVFIGVKYAVYVNQLHENDMWFSNIKQVEREISFRTESGLYFSYYKQLVLAPSISQGIYELINDNRTEHLRTINILERFNIYQEVILGILYRILPTQSLEYVYFYLYTIFGLHGMYITSLFITAWTLSNSWLSGMLAAAFYVFNRIDTTRVSFTMPLRESFGFPFLFAQIAFLTYFLKSNIKQAAKVCCLIGIVVCTFFFVLSWQFSQFILLLQSFALFGVYALGFVSQAKVLVVFSVMGCCLLSVFTLQFGNDMIPSSLVLSFITGCVLLMTFKKEEKPTGNVLSRFLQLIGHILLVLCLMLLINFTIKVALRVESDEHIFKFLLGKIGYGEQSRDFDAMMYLCEPAFTTLPFDTFERLTRGVVLPCYIISTVAVLLLLLRTVFENWSSEDETRLHFKEFSVNGRPELVYTIIQTVFFGVMAVSTLRFKFLWTPHVCVVGAAVFCDHSFWVWALNKIKIIGEKGKAISHLVPVILISLVLFMRLEEYRSELEELKEFYDPNTVELMEWIKEETAPDASFTGSMQLLAGVKLCTDRHITNHPHYENKFLRQRTKEVYQIYARKKPQEVHAILKKHGSNYIILETSICYAQAPVGCRLPDIMDIDNGHAIPELDDNDNTKYSRVSRFCDAIKHDNKFRKYFRKVFENPTFYMYKVL